MRNFTFRNILLVFLILNQNSYSESKPIAAFQGRTTYAAAGAGVGVTAVAILGFSYKYMKKTDFPDELFILVPLIGIPAMIYGVSAGSSRNEDGEFVTFNRQFTQVFYWSGFALLPFVIFFGSHKSKVRKEVPITIENVNGGLRLGYVLRF